MNENELIVYGENGEIVECNFERVDLTRPATIMTYCADVKSAMSEILESTAQMTVHVEEVELTEKDIQQINGLNASLEESEKKQGKNSIVKSVKGVLAKLGIESFQEVLKEDNYGTRFQEYCGVLQKVVDSVESQMQNTLNDIQLKEDIIREMTPLIKQLEVMIQVGLQDKAEFDKETEELKKVADPNNIDQQHEIQYRTQTSQIFNNKLNELEKALVAHKGQIQNYKLQQNGEMELAMANKSYLEDSIPLLKSQGSGIVSGKIHAKRIAKQQALDEVTNQVIIQNAKQLQANSEAIADMTVSGRLRVESLQKMEAAAKNGAQLFKNAKKVRQQNNESERKELQRLSESLTSYNEEFLSLVEGYEVNADVIEVAPQKRLGAK